MSNNEIFNRNVSFSCIYQPHDAIKPYKNVTYKNEVSSFTKYAVLKLIFGQSSCLHFEKRLRKNTEKESVCKSQNEATCESVRAPGRVLALRR